MESLSGMKGRKLFAEVFLFESAGDLGDKILEDVGDGGFDGGFKGKGGFALMGFGGRIENILRAR